LLEKAIKFLLQRTFNLIKQKKGEMLKSEVALAGKISVLLAMSGYEIVIP